MEAAGLDALCVFYPARVAYLTGLHHIPTERPIAVVLAPGPYTALVVPAVEKEHAERVGSVDRVEVYPEYPGRRHPMQFVADVLRAVNAKPERTAADHDGHVPHWGYRGPRLGELTGAPPADGELLVESLRRVKSRAELDCIQLSCDWSARAHRRMQEQIRPGLTEMECYQPAATESLREMIRDLPGWRPRRFDGPGLTAMFVGGRSTAMPHGFVRGRGLQAGDVLVSGAGADIDGYHSELERTMFVGEPDAARRAAFAAMLALQDLAIGLLAPGLPVAAIDLEVERMARELGPLAHLRHPAGHSIGLEGHEAPFLDRGDDTVLEPGMVFTVEPGVYLPELGGFRHSDTVCVTDTGHTLMTDYPRELAALIVPT